MGETALATEKLYDMMMRMASPYAPSGLAAYAISAIDLALWDLKGRVLKLPGVRTAGGPARDGVTCYATGNDTDWHMELGFRATKLACPYGTADGLAAIDRNEEFVAKTRELIGTEVELMLDCWMAFDVEFAVRLAERLRPYRLKLDRGLPDPRGHGAHRGAARAAALAGADDGRALVPPYTFFDAARDRRGRHLPARHPLGRRLHRLPEDRRHRRRRRACTVILHAGMNTPYGQHFTIAMPSIAAGANISSAAAPACRSIAWSACPAPRFRNRAWCAHPTRRASAWRSICAGSKRSRPDTGAPMTRSPRDRLGVRLLVSCEPKDDELGRRHDEDALLAHAECGRAQ